MKKTTATSAGGIIINTKSKKILLVKQYIGNWSFPKGHQEKDEELLDTAQREIFEETGLNNLKVIKTLGSFDRLSSNTPPEEKTIHLFLFETNTKKTRPITTDIKRSKWFKIKKIPKKLHHDEDKKFFTENLENILR